MTRFSNCSVTSCRLLRPITAACNAAAMSLSLRAGQTCTGCHAGWTEAVSAAGFCSQTFRLPFAGMLQLSNTCVRESYLHVCSLHGVQQVVQQGLLGLACEHIKVVQHKDNHLVAPAETWRLSVSHMVVAFLQEVTCVHQLIA